MNIPRERHPGLPGMWHRVSPSAGKRRRGEEGEKREGKEGPGPGRGRCWRLEMGPVGQAEAGASGEGKGEGPTV